MRQTQASGSAGGRGRGWQRWAPYAAVAWSLVYAALGITWALSGRGFPYASAAAWDGMGPLLGWFGPGAVLAAAALGYYYRRRGPCKVCGRGSLSPEAQ